MAVFTFTAIPTLVAIASHLQLGTCIDTFNAKLGDSVVSGLAKKISWGLLQLLSPDSVKFFCTSPDPPEKPAFDAVGHYVKIDVWVPEGRFGKYVSTWEPTKDPIADINDAQSACTEKNLAAWPKPDGWTAAMSVDECKRYVLIVLSSKCATLKGKSGRIRMDDLTPVRALFTSAPAVKKANLATPSQ